MIIVFFFSVIPNLIWNPERKKQKEICLFFILFGFLLSQE